MEVDNGVTVDELAEWVKEQRPEFEPGRYGFQEFSELLNYAQDKGLVRVQANEERGLIVYLGTEFHPPAPPAEPEVEIPIEEEDEPQPIVPGQPTATGEIPEPAPHAQAAAAARGCRANRAATAPRNARRGAKSRPCSSKLQVAQHSEFNNLEGCKRFSAEPSGAYGARDHEDGSADSRLRPAGGADGRSGVHCLCCARGSRRNSGHARGGDRRSPGDACGADRRGPGDAARPGRAAWRPRGTLGTPGRGAADGNAGGSRPDPADGRPAPGRYAGTRRHGAGHGGSRAAGP